MAEFLQKKDLDEAFAQFKSQQKPSIEDGLMLLREFHFHLDYQTYILSSDAMKLAEIFWILKDWLKMNSHLEEARMAYQNLLFNLAKSDEIITLLECVEDWLSGKEIILISKHNLRNLGGSNAMLMRNKESLNRTIFGALDKVEMMQKS